MRSCSPPAAILLAAAATVSVSYGSLTRVRADQPGGLENPPALVNGQAVPWSQLRDLLAETAGGAILEEVVLDRLLSQRLVAERKTLDRRGIDRERSLLMEVLDPNPTTAALSLEALRQRRSLGDRRFELFLRRNAMLRMLVTADVEINDTMIRSQFEQQYGPRFQIRLITTATMNEAATALNRIRVGEPFTEVAATASTDFASAQRGGLLEAISPYDTSYPAVIRQVLADLEPGDLSPIIPVDSGFAILQMVRRIPAQNVKYELVKDDMARSARLAQERILMDNLARQLLAAADIVVLDSALDDGWKRARAQP